MSALRIGVDVDGVLAQFTRAYAQLIKTRTMKVIPEDAHTWNWARAHGITKQEEDDAWKWIKANGWWWGTFDPYDTAELAPLLRAWEHATDLYFITSRPGAGVQRTTALWIREHFAVGNPHVLIAQRPSDKADIVTGLGLTHFVDDKAETVVEVMDAYPRCATRLLTRPWNEEAGQLGNWRIARLNELVEIEVPA